MSRIQDVGDPQNDFTYGAALNPGAPTDCANALTDPTVNFTPATCGYSLTDTRTAVDYIFQTDYTQSFGKHTGGGGSYDNSRVLKYYAVTLQPGNFLAPPATPGAPSTVVDNAPNIGNTYQSYIQDSWRMSSLWGIDYGLRYDFFNIASTQYAQGFGAFSPRIKLTRAIGVTEPVFTPTSGRFFEPFSLENVSPEQRFQLNLPIQPTIAQFDLQPERDTLLEFGGHIPVGAGDLGFRVWQKNANNLIDDTQVGVTLLHQDINYALGRLSQEALSITCIALREADRRWYISSARVISRNEWLRDPTARTMLWHVGELPAGRATRIVAR